MEHDQRTGDASDLVSYALNTPYKNCCGSQLNYYNVENNKSNHNPDYTNNVDYLMYHTCHEMKIEVYLDCMKTN